jgi:transcriptional regulator with XRE-family HTH domain
MSDGTAIARGKRLKRVRQLAGLTRDELANQAGVSKATFSYWENASLSSLSDKGAEKVIKALTQYGITCSLEWLLLGIGNPPQMKNLMFEFPKQATINHAALVNSITSHSLQNEIDLFLSANSNSIVTTVKHTAMSPIIEVGDKVGGIWQPADASFIHDKICIVSLNDQLQLRKVKKITDEGLFDLSYISYINDLPEPFELKNIQLTSVAPIIRIWRD